MDANYASDIVFIPWWNDGASHDCAICGAMMVRAPYTKCKHTEPGWECLSCGDFIPDEE